MQHLTPDNDWQDQLTTLEEQALLRRLRHLGSPQGTVIECDGRTLVNFSSNDYLGLANHPALRDAAKAAIDRHGVGSGASRLVCGTLAPHVELETTLANFKRAEAALTFSSGFATALGTIPALIGKGDVIILDKLAHASLIDAARLSGATMRVFPHNDTEALRTRLQWARDTHPSVRILIVTESVFSMDGDCAALAEIVDLKDEFGAMLLLDEAHAVGVLGPGGRGLAEALGVTSRIDIQLGTLSKALGASGGYICGSRALINLLINRARSFIYSTAPQPAAAAAATCAIQISQSSEGDGLRKKLRDNLHLLGMQSEFQSAIVPVIIGDESAALKRSSDLLDAGLLVPAIRYPTVAKGTARLRITLSATHTSTQIESLQTAIRK